MSKLSFGISFDLIGCVIVVNYEDDEFVTTVYTRRWYLLLLVSFVALQQTLIWATWGPISQSAEAVFSWDDSNIAMCVWIGNVPFALLCIPLSWLMDRKGLCYLLLPAFSPSSSPICLCLLYTSPSPRDVSASRMPSSA